VDVAVRLCVGDVDRFPDIDLELVGERREFVGERNVDVAVQSSKTLTASAVAASNT